MLRVVNRKARPTSAQAFCAVTKNGPFSTGVKHDCWNSWLGRRSSKSQTRLLEVVIDSEMFLEKIFGWMRWLMCWCMIVWCTMTI